MKSLFFNKYSTLSAISILIQQALVGASVYLLIEIGKVFGESGNIPFLSIYFFVALMVIVYLPAFLGTFFLQLAKCLTLDSYILVFKESIKGRIDHTLNSNEKKNREIWGISEGEKVIGEIYEYFYNLFSTTLNSLIPIIIISASLKVEFVISYIISFGICFVLLKVSYSFLSPVSLSQINSLTSLKNHIKSMWSTYCVNNIENTKSWDEVFVKLQSRWTLKSKKVEIYQSLFGMLIVTFSMVPVIGVIIYFLTGDFSTSIKSAIIVSLARQIQIIQSFQNLISLFNQFSIYKAKFSEIAGSCSKISSDNLESRVTYSKIKVDGENIKSFKDLESYINSKNLGRILIQGENGAGKSTCMHLLKQKIANSFYLPSNPDLLFFKSECIGSTGQVVKRRIEQLFRSKSRVLILDEWDANLDSVNKLALDSLIDKISEEKLVVEVRH